MFSCIQKEKEKDKEKEKEREREERNSPFFSSNRIVKWMDC